MRRPLALFTFLVGTVALAQAPRPLALDETTIAQIEAALRDGSLTCRSLVEQYLARIDADDKKGAALNAIVLANPDALKVADDLDRRFRPSGPWAWRATPAIPFAARPRTRRSSGFARRWAW